ncbi:flagellar basal-body MS-ring/collar protein FliF [Brevundimonas faecalis]|uniref:Flagellar M-ring protein FliF n=1 Tax=Brevundimonas faecalis TaxID=947378 RepID=A0ABV2R7K1_9CAUL
MTPLQRLRALPPVAQALVGLAALAVLTGLLAAAWYSTRPRYEVLFRDLRPADAAMIVARLDETKTPYRLADGGSTILTPKALADAARLDIAGSDMPLKGAVGFELFNKSDMGLTEFAQRINYQRALQGELARTIMTVEGVDSARVHLTLPEPSVFRNDRKPPRASVTIVTVRGVSLDEGAVAGIQRLVAASVTDMDVADVVVLDQSGHVLNPAVATTPEAVSPELQQARAIEQYYVAAVRSALAAQWPDARVEVVIPLHQWGPGAAGSDSRDQALTAWTRTSRAFDIRVSVMTPDQADAASRTAVREQLLQAGVLRETDALLFPLSPALAAPIAEKAAPAAPVEARPTKAASSSARFDWRWLAVPVLGVALLILLRRLWAPRRLGADQRAAWARRLSRLVEGADHGL